MIGTPDIQVGGTLHPQASLYVPRPEDDAFVTMTQSRRAWLNIYGCRTMGKSSLYARHLLGFQSQDVAGIVVDVAAQVGTPKSATDWFRLLAEAWSVSGVLDPAALDRALSGTRSNATGIVAERLFSRGLLVQESRPIVLVLDEYDYIAQLPFRDDILFALRHIQSMQARTTQFSRLAFCLVGLQPIVRFGTAGAANTSPICAPIEMRDFDRSSATLSALRSGFTPDEQPDESVLACVLDLSGGQPFVTMQLLSEVRRLGCRTTADVRRMAEELVSASGLGRDLPFFQAIEDALVAFEDRSFAALSAYRSMLEGSVEAQNAPGVDLLLLCGLLRQRDERLEIKGSLFRRRFDSAWAERLLSQVASSTKTKRYRSKSSDASLCVINTGGPIGMIDRGAYVTSFSDAAEFTSYFPGLKSIASTIEIINLFPPRDSVNVFPNQWITIARYIYERRHDGFNGFVVTHGTDTMAYTASAVAFALGQQLRFPVVFTGAQTTPDVVYGDAHVNLYRACAVAKQAIPEVVISFGNFVYRAVRAQKKDDRRFDGFESPTFPPLAEITEEINVRHELLRPLPVRARDIELRAFFEQSILVVPVFPGLEPDFFAHLLSDDDADKPCKGVIVQTLGGGSVPTEPPYSFLPFVNRAYRRSIPVVVTSQHPPDLGGHRYTPAHVPVAAGAIHVGNMTLPAAVTKFRWVLANAGRRKGWRLMSPIAKHTLVSKLMVEHSLIGEF